MNSLPASGLYNLRAEDSTYERLTFCLLGVGEPTDLIRDPRVTPFNVGAGSSCGPSHARRFDAFGRAGSDRPGNDRRATNLIRQHPSERALASDPK